MRFFFLLLFLASLSQGAWSAEVERPSQAQTCVACHGEKGRSTNPQYPILAGQEMYYLYLQLMDFQAGRRMNAQMAGVLKGINKDELRDLAEYFAAQKWPDINYKSDPKLVKKAKKAAAAGECTQCHLGNYRGNSRIPRLAGQHAQYLESTMLDFKNKKRTNSPAKNSLFATFSQEEIKALADFLAGL